MKYKKYMKHETFLTQKRDTKIECRIPTSMKTEMQRITEERAKLSLHYSSMTDILIIAFEHYIKSLQNQ